MAVVLASALWPAAPASAKDYSFPEVLIDATILPDGTLDIVSTFHAFATTPISARSYTEFAKSSPGRAPSPAVLGRSARAADSAVDSPGVAEEAVAGPAAAPASQATLTPSATRSRGG
ncbi:MAG TPA: hypothetical protein VE575_03940 [Acidimicrobiales bacterium]|nr:hypothetical protein [Acidimicrobiales bacterium]